MDLKFRPLLVCVLTVAIAAPAGADDSPPDAGRAFNVDVHSEPLYGIKPPWEDPAKQEHILTAHDGTELFIETWLPTPKDGNIPPARMPTILVMTPYTASLVRVASRDTLQMMVPRGYAFTQMHLRGTNRSGGCLQFGGAIDAMDGARVIEWLGKHAPWSNGRIGGVGRSYGGGAILNVAARGSRSSTKYLKAIMAAAPGVSAYDGLRSDGVSSAILSELLPEIYFEYTIAGTEPQRIPQRIPCYLEAQAAALDPDGGLNSWFRDREVRLHVSKIRQPLFMAHGHADLIQDDGAAVLPSNLSGMFDELSAEVVKVGVFGIFGHELPSEHDYESIRPASWVRPDFDRMSIAWWDHWLKDIDGGIDGWPVAQVQGTDGQWRAEKDWPTTGGRSGQLVLGDGQALGIAGPSGSSTFVEGGPQVGTGYAPGTSLVFQSAQLPGRLEITGRPILDLWVKLDRPAAHLTARLETFDADGNPIRSGMTWGMRSARHIDPVRNGVFTQYPGKSPPINEPVNVQIRLQPTDLVIPEGGTVRLTVAGGLQTNPGFRMVGVPDEFVRGPSRPSGAATVVTVMHDCATKVSALRFEMPDETPDLLNVQEVHETAPVASNPVNGPMESTGGGIASAPACAAG